MSTRFQNLIIMMKILFGWALNPIRIAITQQVGIYNQGMLDVKNKVELLDRLDQLLKLTGIATNKKRLKGLLCEMLVSITYPVKSYCIKNNLDELLDEIKTPFSIYMGMGTQSLIKEAQRIHNLLLPMITELQDGGLALTVDNFTVLQQAIDSFNHAANAPAEARGDRKNINKQIDTLVKEANAICHNILDENIISFKPISADYVQEYKIKRQVPKQIRHTRMDATVVTETGTPLQATVTVDAFTKDGRTFKAVSGTTDENGFVSVKEFESGMRTVTVSGTGIVTKTFGPYKFEHGKAIVDTLVCQEAFNLPAPQKTKEKRNA